MSIPHERRVILRAQNAVRPPCDAFYMGAEITRIRDVNTSVQVRLLLEVGLSRHSLCGT